MTADTGDPFDSTNVVPFKPVRWAAPSPAAVRAIVDRHRATLASGGDAQAFANAIGTVEALKAAFNRACDYKYLHRRPCDLLCADAADTYRYLLDGAEAVCHAAVGAPARTVGAGQAKLRLIRDELRDGEPSWFAAALERLEADLAALSDTTEPAA